MGNVRLSKIDNYRIQVFDIALKVTPPLAAVAAVLFTALSLLGYQQTVSPYKIIIFDIVCAGYFILSGVLRHRVLAAYGSTDPKLAGRMGTLALNSCLFIQWNLITYLFPSRDLWASATFYMVISAIMLSSKAVLYEFAVLFASIGVSWAVLGDSLLPAHDEMFVPNMLFRLVTLFACAGFTYLIAASAERLLTIAEKDADDLTEKNIKLESMNRDVISFTADLVEQRDYTSGTHVKRVKEYTRILASEVAACCPEYGLDDEMIDTISRASVLHDVGKITVPDAILLKPGRLTDEEFDRIKKHTVSGAEIIDRMPESLDRPFIECAKEIAVGHHEKYDGKGYPSGTSGSDIPISAQIVSIADCFDALTSDRPYKKAFSPDTASDMILSGECGVFSEEMLKCFSRCEEKFKNVCSEYDKEICKDADNM